MSLATRGPVSRPLERPFRSAISEDVEDLHPGGVGERFHPLANMMSRVEELA